MELPHRTALILVCAWAVLLLDGPVDRAPTAQAQSSRFGSRSDGSEETSRRDGWRGRFGSRDGDRGRDSRDSGDQDTGDGESEERSSHGESSTRSASPSTPSRSTSSASSEASGMSIRDWAVGLVKQYDKDGDGMLKGDELRELRGRAAEADLNNDGVITVDELVTHLSGASTSGANASSTSSRSSSATSSESSERRERGSPFSFRRGDRDRSSDDVRRRSDSGAAAAAKRVFYGSAGGNASGDAEKDKRLSYRFTPPVERLPANLPSWFKSRDTNGDGQVSMSEFSRTWNERTVAEFRRYDLNGDGIITSEEAARAK